MLKAMSLCLYAESHVFLLKAMLFMLICDLIISSGCIVAYPDACSYAFILSLIASWPTQPTISIKNCNQPTNPTFQQAYFFDKQTQSSSPVYSTNANIEPPNQQTNRTNKFQLTTQTNQPTKYGMDMAPVRFGERMEVDMLWFGDESKEEPSFEKIEWSRNSKIPTSLCQ